MNLQNPGDDRRDPPAAYLTTSEAAALLGVALRTVQLWVESGTLRAWKTAGGHRRIERGSVEALLAAKVRPAPVPGREAEPLRVLLVEDEAAMLQLLVHVAQGWNLPLTIATATDGFGALTRIGALHPHLLITDLNMPGLDGFRMVRWLRSNLEYAELEIVVVTALDRGAMADRGGLPDGVRVYAKPAPFSELEAIARSRRAAMLASWTGT